MSYQILGRWGCWLVVCGLLMAGSVCADPFEGLTWEQRWEIADSLDQSSRQAVGSGDYASALQLIDGALAAHPSHYRSWMNRWNLQLRQGLEGDVPEEELAASILQDFSRVEAADTHEDQVYVLSFADGRLFQLTADSTHLQRRVELLQIIGTRNFQRAELAQMLGHELDIEQGEASGAQPLVEMDEGDLARVTLARIHALAKERAAERQTVKAADQAIVSPTFDAVGVAGGEQLFV